jgi:hypothetical protein
MSVFAFHNKFHRSNHHTIALSGFPDSASDPIASKEFPYLGIFHNQIYDYEGNYLTLDNSYNWKSTYDTTSARSETWDKFLTTYTTVCSFSGNWNNNISLFSTMTGLSSRWQSFQKTYDNNINSWNLNIDNAVYDDVVQSYTRQKTFSAFNLRPNLLTNFKFNIFPNNFTKRSICFGKDKFVVIGDSQTMLYSIDGTNWLSSLMPLNAVWRSLTFGNGRFVAITTNNFKAAYSDDGINWVPTNLPALRFWTQVTYANGRFIAISSGQFFAYSDNGIDWVDVNIGFSRNWNAITYGNNKFVASCTDNGSIKFIYSENNGLTWNLGSHSMNNFTSGFISIAYGNGIFVAIRNSASILAGAYSYDGINWITFQLPIFNGRKIIFNDGMFVISNFTSYVHYSVDGLNWFISPPNVLTSFVNWADMVYGLNRFLIINNNTSSAVNYVSIESANSILWSLSSAQVGIEFTTNNINFSGFDGAKKGGIYNLLLIADANCLGELSAKFNPDYFKFPLNKNDYKFNAIQIRKFQFLYDGQFLNNTGTFLYDIDIPTRDLYYAGSGILLFENTIQVNPISLDFGESFSSHEGLSLTIDGSEPYDSSATVSIQKLNYNKDFTFTFLTSGALSATPPFGKIGSKDKIDIVYPDTSVLTVTDDITASRSISLNRCDPYQSVQIITRSYGYIKELIINDVYIKDLIFRPEGYINNEIGHTITSDQPYYDAKVQSIFVKFGVSAPTLPTLSSGISLWLDAMDFSTVKFQNINGFNFVTELSSKISGADIYFTSNPTTSSFYDIIQEKSISYNLSSTHTRNLMLSGNLDFATHTVFTPHDPSDNTEWIWANANYGVFKLPLKYSVGVGTLDDYYEYEYGIENKNKPICISTRCLSGNILRPSSQGTILNDTIGVSNVMSITAQFHDSITMIGGKDEISGFSRCELHEMLLYKGFKTFVQVEQVHDYLLDKWKIV